LNEQVRSEVQQQAIQELTQNLQEKCFDKCITNPKGKLDGKQQNCVALCINRYIDAMKVVSNTMMERGQVRLWIVWWFVFTGC
jgi:mitochondrial import inner membrane translocase subunit TIM13